MDRTRSNLTLAALLLAVGYIVGQAVGPRGADAGVAKGWRDDQVVTMADDNPSRIVVWQLAGDGVSRAMSHRLTTTEEGRHIVESLAFNTPTSITADR